MDQKQWYGKEGGSALPGDGMNNSPAGPAAPPSPPPPYSHDTRHPQSNADNTHPVEQASSSPYPPQPHHLQAITRTLHVYYENWKMSSVRILDSDNATEIYNAESHMRKPNLIVKIAATGATLGTATFHLTTSRIDTQVRDTPIALQTWGILGRKGHRFPSAALGGAFLRWKYDKHMSLDLFCVDEHDVVVARFHFSNWSLSKCGRLELVGPLASGNDGGGVMEEVLVTGLAMAQYVLTTATTVFVAAV